MEKRFTVLLISFLGISTILVYLAIGAFLFQKDLLFPKVQASPATCTVSDDLDVTGNIRTIDSITIDSWDSQLKQGCTWGGCALQGIKRSVGGAFGWNSNMLYINGWNEWGSGVSIGGPGGTSDLTVTGDLIVDGNISAAIGGIVTGNSNCFYNSVCTIVDTPLVRIYTNNVAYTFYVQNKDTWPVGYTIEVDNSLTKGAIATGSTATFSTPGCGSGTWNRYEMSFSRSGGLTPRFLHFEGFCSNARLFGIYQYVQE